MELTTERLRLRLWRDEDLADYARFFMNKLVEHFDRYLGRGPR